MRVDGELRDGFGVAVDVGTTSVVLALVDLSSGEIAARHSFFNPQRVFGGDVISRIHAANEGHLQEMQGLIAKALDDGIAKLCKTADLRGECDIAETVIAGNTAMIHLLCGISCEGLARYPFSAEAARDAQFASKTIVPYLTPFIGGDIVSGLLYVMPFAPKNFLLVDLGTNGEMAFFNNGALTTASAAAGSAFEQLSGGASGAIAELARLIRSGEIDETGLFKACERDATAKKIFSQKQVRDLQLAKSAIRSGIEILLDAANKSPGKAAPEATYLAGGIGTAMCVKSAAEIGLIPPNLSTSAVGNASLGGAIRLVLSPTRAREDLCKILKTPTEIVLAEHPLFEELFLEYMDF